jgi:hypothetical protein
MGTFPLSTGKLMISSIVRDLPVSFPKRKAFAVPATNPFVPAKQTLSLDYTTEGAQNASGFQK